MAFEVILTFGGLAVILAFLFYKTREDSQIRPLLIIFSLLCVFVLLFSLTILRADFNATKTLYNSGGGLLGYEVTNATATLDGGTTGVVITFFQAFSWVFWMVIAFAFLAFLFGVISTWKERARIKKERSDDIFDFGGGRT